MKSHAFSRLKQKQEFEEFSRFSKYLIVMQLTALVSAIYISNYFDFHILEAISYKNSDGWCDELTRQGIGNHCFGDFYYGFNFVNLDNPYTGGFINAYPPFALFLLKPFIYLNNLFPGRVISLALYLIISCLCLLIGVRRLTSNLQHEKRFIMSVVCLFSAPVIVSLDRGNNISYLFLLLVFFLDSVSKGQEFRAIVFGTIMTLLKPQMLALSLIFFNRNTIRPFLKLILTSTCSLVASFLLYPSSFPQNITNWMQVSGAYQTYSGTSIMPVNISLSNTLGILKSFIKYLCTGDLQLYSFSGKFNFILTLFLVILVALKIFFNKDESYNLRERSLLVVTLIVISPGTSFQYYYLLLLPFITICLNKNNCKNTNQSNSKIEVHRSIKNTLCLLMFLVVPCWTLPANILLHNKVETVASLHWQMANMMLATLFFVAITKRNKTKANWRESQ